MHRRGRALRKFAKQLTEGTVVMSSRAMQNYIMPYAMIALFDEKLLKVCSLSLFFVCFSVTPVFIVGFIFILCPSMSP